MCALCEVSREHNTTAMAICQYLSVLSVCEQYVQEAWCTTPWQWLSVSFSLYFCMWAACALIVQAGLRLQHCTNRFTDGQMCMSMENIWGDTRRQKDKTQFNFKICSVFSTGNSQEVCEPNHHLLVEVDYGAACTPSGYVHVSCQYSTILFVSICQYIHHFIQLYTGIYSYILVYTRIDLYVRLNTLPRDFLRDFLWDCLLRMCSFLEVFLWDIPW
jgi:hypothetical protein